MPNPLAFLSCLLITLAVPPFPFAFPPHPVTPICCIHNNLPSTFHSKIGAGHFIDHHSIFNQSVNHQVDLCRLHPFHTQHIVIIIVQLIQHTVTLHSTSIASNTRHLAICYSPARQVNRAGAQRLRRHSRLRLLHRLHDKHKAFHGFLNRLHLLQVQKESQDPCQIRQETHRRIHHHVSLHRHCTPKLDHYLEIYHQTAPMWSLDSGSQSLE